MARWILDLPVRSMLALALTLVPLQRTSAQNMTWIVNASGGPGVHFTDLPPAVLAASPGDVLLVHGGTYSPFLLDKGLTILGLVPGTVDVRSLAIDSGIVIRDLPADQTAVLAEIRSSWIQVLDCYGPVLFDQVTDPPWYGALAPCLWVDSCADVRVARSELVAEAAFKKNQPIPFGIRVARSRVEFANSLAIGGKGLSCEYNQNLYAKFGAPGLDVDLASRVHVSRSTIIGGDGGDGFGSTCFACFWESGAWALDLRGASVVIATGISIDKLQGGKSGAGYCPLGGGECCTPAVRLSTGAVFRHSGLSVNGFQNNGGTQFSPSPPDPTLELVGTAHPGMPVTLRVYGNPGAACSLDMGRKPIVEPTPFTEVEILVESLATLPLGNVPASGELDFVFTVPNLPLGSLLVAQANLAYSPVDRRRTNSALLVIQ